MIKDEFKLSKMNLILIVLDVFLVIFVIIIGIDLINSFNDKENEIPDLRTTAGKSSTLEADLTKTTVEQTVETTTKKQGNLNSPYYDLSVDELFNNELFTNGSSSMSKDNQIEVIKSYFKILCALYDVTDDDIVNTSYLLEHVKSGEYDSISANDHKYGIVYNGSALLNRLFYKVNKNETHTKLTLNGTPVLVESNGNYYKLENTIGEKNFDVTSYTISAAISNGYMYGKIIYYDSNYKDKGLTKPTYESADLTLRYDEKNAQWKVSSFDFPGLEG